MSKNFSPPRSAPNAASVTTTSDGFNPDRVAITELQPCAMLANGPPWISAGEPSSICTRLGAKASRSSAASAPSACRSRAMTAVPSRRSPTWIRPRRSCRSARSRARQNTAITSLETVMSNPFIRGAALKMPTRTLTMARSARSFISGARRQVTRRGSMHKPVGLMPVTRTSAPSGRSACAATKSRPTLPCTCRTARARRRELPRPQQSQQWGATGRRGRYPNR